jgi:ATP-dependent Lhr-like helicase
MSSPISASERAASHAAFDRYHPAVQRWINDQGWQSLRPLQHRAAEPVLAAMRDVVISAATASGKTEAAWLPIVSRLAFDRDEGADERGVKALYVSPLKALINDQAMRITTLAERVSIPVNRRHGDVQGKERDAIRKDPDGILLITPESLEAMFVLNGSQVPVTFAGLRYVVIDELHSFIGRERGAQLQSLLHRLERAIGRQVPRIGLSATIADLRMAAEFMRPRAAAETVIIEDTVTTGAGLRLQVRGYRSTATSRTQEPEDAADNAPLPAAGATDITPSTGDAPDAAPLQDEALTLATTDGSAVHEIALHLHDTLRLTTNLVFAGSRANVEVYTDALKRLASERRTPDVFWPHHGNLSRGIREETEARLKQPDVPATAICTSTLEMGIDIGKADAVAQIGTPYNVASLRQRMGRSGRRGTPAILRVYITEQDLDGNTGLADALRLELVETLAIIDLMLNDKWYEPPDMRLLHLSTLVQQVLSMIAQNGGSRADRLYAMLCATGPFVHVTKETFITLLRNLAAADLIVQEAGGTLLLGEAGEKVVNHYTFYAAFDSDEEFRVLHDGRQLGTIPISPLIRVGDPMIFAGRRWEIADIDDSTKTVHLRPTRLKKAPTFPPGVGQVADKVRQRMRQILAGDTPVDYLNTTGSLLLEEGRAAYRHYDLSNRIGVTEGAGCSLVLFRGDLLLTTLMTCLQQRGIETTLRKGVLRSETTSLEGMRHAIHALVHGPVPDPYDIASIIPVKQRDKHDRYLDEHLLTLSAANRDILLGETLDATREILALGERAFQGGVVEPMRPS